ncbi:MAG: putative enzyme related to lactoylglutathione lyase [Pirellulaceae bacterium]|jgi:predicted enzyme related to lactoylglutathione lyase
MSESKTGKVGWIDLTVPNADEVRDFYSKVANWDVTPVAMGEYNDYCMHPPGDETPVAGICHAKGTNADLPAQWLIYITVADLAGSLEKVVENGGKIIQQRSGEGGHGAMAIIQDPSGAVSALYQG